MKNMKLINKQLAFAVAFAMTGAMTVPTVAQDSENADTAVEEVSVLGSRRKDARSALDAAVPIDVISSDELLSQGDTNAIDSLIAVIPSLNASREPISDAATLVRPVNLRGLAADHTLVLLNGKRHHRGAVVGEFVSGTNRGAQGVDVTPLFGASLKQVEVLRDGAAAQYGSDAIAGVINFALQDDPSIRKLTAQYGQAYEGDGTTMEVSGVFGTQLGAEGFAVAAFEIRDAEPTSRGVQDGEGSTGGATGLAAAGFPVNDPVVVWGAPEVKNDYKLMLNAGLPLANGSELYSFGTYATRDVDGSFFYRNPTNRTGVFADGDGNVLFADSNNPDPAVSANTCPLAPLPTTSFAAAQAFIDSAPANCFAYNSDFPGGFTPRFGGNVSDHSFAVGLRGEFSNEMYYDFSVVNGKNKLDYQLFNTVNASLGENSPFNFDLGSQIQSETVINADFSKGFPVANFASDLNVAFGLQHHDETFEITPGQEESYIAGPYSATHLVGSNGFAGFSPEVSGEFNRDSLGAYVDLEADITDSFLLSAAMRYEDFSDFGTTTNGKLAARYNVNDNFTLRGAISTGFRAPSVGQSNLQRSATNFSGGQLTELLVVSAISPYAVILGGEQLQPEDATNLSIGFTTSVGNLDLTVDYFDIDVENRIAQITDTLTPAQQATLVGQGVTGADRVSQVSFFVNDFDTNTSGIDVVANYPLEWANSSTNVTLAMNFTDTEVTNRGDTITDARATEVEDSTPAVRTNLSFDHSFDPFSALVRVNYYGEAYESLFNDEGAPVVTDGMFIVDAELGFQYNDTISFAVGAKNLFDNYPDEWTLGGDTGRTPGYLGAIYPLNHPAGLGGGQYYLRIKAEF